MLADGFGVEQLQLQLKSWTDSASVIRKMQQAYGKCHANPLVWAAMLKEVSLPAEDRMFQPGFEEFLQCKAMNSLGDLDSQGGDVAYSAIGRFLNYSMSVIKLAGGTRKTLASVGFSHIVEKRKSTKDAKHAWNDRTTRFTLLFVYVIRMHVRRTLDMRVRETNVVLTATVEDNLRNLGSGVYDSTILLASKLLDKRGLATMDLTAHITPALLTEIIAALFKKYPTMAIIKAKPGKPGSDMSVGDNVDVTNLHGKIAFVNEDACEAQFWNDIAEVLAGGVQWSLKINHEQTTQVLIMGSPPWGVHSGLRYKTSSGGTATNDVALTDAQISRYVFQCLSFNVCLVFHHDHAFD